jgi:hypothetical protein
MMINKHGGFFNARCGSGSQGKEAAMKKAAWIVMLGALILMSGCTRYTHPYKSEADMRTDLEECQRTVRQDERESTGSDDPYWEQTRINDCMRRKGWQQKSIF